MRAYGRGEIAFSAPNPHGWSYRLCTGTTSTAIIAPLVGAWSAFPLFGDFLSSDSFNILSIFEDSHFLAGGSDVVHCV